MTAKRLALFLVALTTVAAAAQEAIPTIQSITERSDKVLIAFDLAAEAGVALADYDALVFVSFNAGKNWHQITEGLTWEAKALEAKGNVAVWQPSKSPGLKRFFAEGGATFRIYVAHKKASVHGMTPYLAAIEAVANPKAKSGTALKDDYPATLDKALGKGKAFPSLASPATAKDGKGPSVEFEYVVEGKSEKQLVDYRPLLAISFDDGATFHLVTEGIDGSTYKDPKLGKNTLIWYPAKSPALKEILVNKKALFRITLAKLPAKYKVPEAKSKGPLKSILAIIKPPAETGTDAGAGAGTDLGADDGAEADTGNDAGSASPPIVRGYPVINHQNFTLQIQSIEKVRMNSRYELHVVMRVGQQPHSVLRTTQFTAVTMMGRYRRADGSVASGDYTTATVFWNNYICANPVDLSPFGIFRHDGPSGVDVLWTSPNSVEARVIFSDVDGGGTLTGLDWLRFSFDGSSTTVNESDFGLAFKPDTFAAPLGGMPEPVYPIIVWHEQLAYYFEGGRYIVEGGTTYARYSLRIYNPGTVARTFRPANGMIQATLEVRVRSNGALRRDFWDCPVIRWDPGYEAEGQGERTIRPGWDTFGTLLFRVTDTGVPVEGLDNLVFRRADGRHIVITSDHLPPLW
jgi:hypothetical protein